LMANDQVKVRMYNVGFGDCFLLHVRVGGKTSKILFDCGSVKHGPMSMEDIVARIIRDVTDTDGEARIDVVVATHRHKDHVSGFANNLWKKVTVKEVWMPWTENPSDVDAEKIRERQSRLALSLRTVAQQRQATLAATAAPEERVRLSAVMDLAVNALSNEAAMAMLHTGFAGKPLRRFLPTLTDSATFETDALPHSTINVLGPSRDARVIKDMDPPIGQSYLRLLDGRGPDNDIPEPFREDWWLDYDLDPVGLLLSTADRQKISGIGGDVDFNVALALDKALNGTSLMLLLEIGKARLLFPGDAQWGTWRAALENPKWRQLMSKTTFYKIGHHGSHNATPVEFVEDILGADFWAMVSTAHVQHWPFIPKEELLAALSQKCNNRVARTDIEKSVPSGYTVKPDEFIELEISI